MKGTIDLATVGIIASFALQGAIVFGYLKAPVGNQAKRDPPLDLTACFATSTFSVIVMMLCATPLVRLPDDMLKVLISAVVRLRPIVAIALVMMALVVAVVFLDGFVVLSFFPEVVAVFLYYAVEFFSARQPRGESSPHEFAFRIVATTGFTLMTGLYAAFLGTDHYSVYLKAAMFILLLAVLSSLSRLVIPLHVPDVGGAVALVALAFPAVALLSACPLVLMVKGTMDDPEKDAPPKDGLKEQPTQATNKILKCTTSFAQGTIATATGILTAGFSVHKDVLLHRHVLVAGGCFLVIAYLSALLLVYLKMSLSGYRQLHKGHIRFIQFLCVISGAALVATNSLLLLLISEGNGLLSLNLLPIQGLIGILAYRATPTEDSMHNEVFEAGIKSGRKVALFATATAFAVQTTLLFGYLNNSNFRKVGHRFDLSVSFLASALSVFLVVATCMPLGYRTEAARDKVLSLVRYLKDAVIALLAVTAVLIGKEFLGGDTVLALFPEMTVAAMYYAVNLFTAETAEPGQRDAEEHKMEILPTAVVATFGFGMLGAAYASLLGTPEYDMYTKALVFTLLAAVISSLGRVAGPLCAPQRDKNAAACVVFLSNILPIVEMLVAVPLAAKVVINVLPAS
ncbi:hypothetical protein BAE44_0002263 [Dichanthelium oligosanthes]|uniref:Uncharacterized protein n=1 Tax=Dichanthelium oligosanthes TaxID=888268 RepID=A0A1E5WH43_9POAL|nr:hypothetical protein BAE44_0002263 [Dichanthelium oligosanthes]